MLEITRYVALLKNRSQGWDIYTSSPATEDFANYQFISDYELPFRLFGINRVDAWVANMLTGETMAIMVDQRSLFMEINMAADSPWILKV